MMEWKKGEFTVSDDTGLLDLETIYGMLAQTYWAADRSKEQILRAIRHSICLGLYKERQQVGFVRAVTDHAVVTWIGDVIIHPYFRGNGLGKWLVSCLVEHPALQGTNMMLGTKDAHGLYEKFGFERREMMRRPAGISIHDRV